MHIPPVYMVWLETIGRVLIVNIFIKVRKNGVGLGNVVEYNILNETRTLDNPDSLLEYFARLYIAHVVSNRVPDVWSAGQDAVERDFSRQ